ncbi:MAG: 50S ribosomal protein L4 [Candidatus Nitronauta litoralis]|uniref:Large ribosomal subunit protein uL4 n=1 Tax=Candidatus Nitronauta litoralis TaxID=2705533 RepID=A0A7T0BVT4_9BACT|nr:MAG: 50S ribosomal protein L4 [Candidatus Nitronauta litoralis]
MAELEVKDKENNKVETVAVSDDVFGVTVREHLVQRYVVMQLASRRSGTAKTQNSRCEVRGGGKKPWRQKGTGRARQGSIRSANWVGGMTVFGPAPRDYSFPLSKKSKKLAIKSVLTDRLQNGGITVVKDLSLEEPKTRHAVALLGKLELPAKTLFLLGDENENLRLAVRNIPQVDCLSIEGLNVYDLLRHERIVLTPETVKKIEERLN